VKGEDSIDIGSMEAARLTEIVIAERALAADCSVEEFDVLITDCVAASMSLRADRLRLDRELERLSSLIGELRARRDAITRAR
jgi:hypothetical protein